MNWLTKLFKKPIHPTIVDPVFGEMTFDRGIWEHVPSKREDALIMVGASESGPSEIQRKFFSKIRAQLTSFVTAARSFVEQESEDPIRGSELSLYAIEIGPDADAEKERFVLELTDKEQGTIHRVTFQSERPVGYTFDH